MISRDETDSGQINRIKRHTDIRKTLQEEGISYRTAETVASASDNDLKSTTSNTTFLNLFGPKIKDSTVTRFKLFMVSSFGMPPRSATVLIIP